MSEKELNLKKIMDYSSENRKGFNELSKLCMRQMIVPYIGAGMSVFAGKIQSLKYRSMFPLWKGLVNTQYKNCFGKEKPDSMNLFDAAEEIEKWLGKDVFYKNISDTMGGDLKDEEWNELLVEAKKYPISIIPQLFFGPIVTTNFDQIIEKIHKELLVAFPYHTEDLEKAIDKRKHLLYKIHGCVSKPNEIVLAKEKYEEVYKLNSELVKSLSEFCQGFHFLFLGCSLEKDYPIDLLLELQDKSEMPHYAIIECKENATIEDINFRRKELEEKNIFPILYEYGKHESIKIVLDELLKINKSQLFKAPEYNQKFPFIDRTDSIIEKIANNLKFSEYSILALNGNAGVGKTRIMSEYANETKEKYTNIFWFNAISDDNVKEEIRKFIFEKKHLSKEELGIEKILESFRNWLKENSNYLFLLDNVENYEDIKDFLDFDRTLTGTRHILITSRLNKNELPNISTIPINVFEKEQARKFLESHTDKKPDEYADKIADMLGYLPLALEQAATYIREENEIYQCYFEELEKQPFEILGKKHPESGAVPVRATWNITMQRIKSESATELLRLCSFFEADNIIDYWFIKAFDILPQPLQDNIKDNELNNIETKLEKYSLIKITDSDNGDYKKISIHRLLQGVVQKTLEKDEAEKYAACCLDLIGRIIDWNEIGNKDTINSFRLGLPHAVTIAKRSRDFFIEIGEELEKISLIFYHSSRIYAKMSYLDSAKGYCNECIEILEKFYKEIGIHADNLFMAYNNRGLIYSNMLEYDKAIEEYNRSICIGEQISDQDPLFFESLAKAYMNRGIAYQYKKMYEKALADKEKSIEMYDFLYTNNFLSDENGRALAYMNRGALYESLKKYKEALLDIDKSIEIWKRLANEGKFVDNNNLSIAYMNRSITSSKVIFEKNEERLSNEGYLKYNRKSSTALLNYRRKQKT